MYLFDLQATKWSIYTELIPRANVKLIVGVCIGLLALLIASIVVWRYMKRRKQDKENKKMLFDTEARHHGSFFEGNSETLIAETLKPRVTISQKSRFSRVFTRTISSSFGELKTQYDDLHHQIHSISSGLYEFSRNTLSKGRFVTASWNR